MKNQVTHEGKQYYLEDGDWYEGTAPVKKTQASEPSGFDKFKRFSEEAHQFAAGGGQGIMNTGIGAANLLRSALGKSEYPLVSQTDPESIGAQLGEFSGKMLPYFALPSGALAGTASAAALGAAQGGDRPIQGAAESALGFGVGQGLFKGGGQLLQRGGKSLMRRPAAERVLGEIAPEANIAGEVADATTAAREGSSKAWTELERAIEGGGSFDTQPIKNSAKEMLSKMENEIKRMPTKKSLYAESQDILNQVHGAEIDTLPEAIAQAKDLNRLWPTADKEARKVIEEINKTIYERVGKDASSQGMGSVMDAYDAARKATIHEKGLFGRYKPGTAESTIVSRYLPKAKDAGITSFQKLEKELGSRLKAKEALKSQYFRRAANEQDLETGIKTFKSVFNKLSPQQQKYLFKPAELKTIKNIMLKGGGRSIGEHAFRGLLGYGVGGRFGHELIGGALGLGSQGAISKITDPVGRQLLKRGFAQGRRAKVTPPGLGDVLSKVLAGFPGAVRE
jgi:vacuolar-type H+-ATPase subunit H